MDSITQLLTGCGGVALFFVVFADQVGLPVPAPPWVLAAGALVAHGRLHPAVAVGMTASATVLADLIWFCLGRKGGGRVLRLMSRWTFSHNASIPHTKAFVGPPGLCALMVAKFLPGPVMSALAGALGMSTRRFLLFDGLAAVFYGSSYVTAGYLFHNQIQQVLIWLGRLGHGAVALLLVLVVGYIAYKYILRRRARVSKGRQSSPPDQEGGLADNGADAANLATDGPERLEAAHTALASASSNLPMPVSTPQLP